MRLVNELGRLLYDKTTGKLYPICPIETEIKEVNYVNF